MNIIMKDKIYLFDGDSLDGFYDFATGGAAAWEVRDGVMTVTHGNIVSKREYGDAQLHVEFCLPYMPEMTGQNRANSGVYVQGCYEVQVLDSYGKDKPAMDDCGAIYQISAPLTNACKAPGEWQSYDIYLRTARFGEDGTLEQCAVITVVLNGTVIQNNLTLHKNTPGGVYERIVAKGPLLLQDHGCPVSYRNIWLREL